MFTKKTIRDIDLNGKKVLVRVDFNLPLNDDGSIADSFRVKQALPTIKYLLENNCKIILMSHLGRPESPSDPKASLRVVVPVLSELIGRDVQFVDDCIGEKVEVLASHLEAGQVLLLENVRYHQEEEENSPEFAQAILDATGAEVYVQDAFGVVHRAHASIEAIAKKLPSVAGLLLEREVDTITNAIEDPKRPLMVVVGGEKISDKIEILKKFIEIGDFVAIVGAMANTFLDAMGVPIGSSVSEKDEIEVAKDIIEMAEDKAKKTNFTLFIPRDVVVSKAMNASEPTRIVDLSNNNWADISAYPNTPARELFEVAGDEMILDIGPFTAAYIAGAAKMAKTAIWNGTCGVTEIKGIGGAADPYSHGTRIVVEGLVGESAGGSDHPFTIVGGGDTVSYIESIEGLKDRFGHVSTGGGASLELMAGKILPGVAVLEDKEQ